MHLTLFSTPVLNHVLRFIALIYLKCIGWKCEGQPPDIPKYIMLAAPHTSNWDLPIMLAIALRLRLDIYWMGKKAIFFWPLGWFFKWLGGISIDRSKRNSTVDQTVEIFNNATSLVIVIPPEGTRGKTKKWKSGFYHIAVGAQLPILCGFLDYGRKVGGVGDLFHLSGDMEKDIPKIQAFYKDITPRYPQQFDDHSDQPDIASK